MSIPKLGIIRAIVQALLSRWAGCPAWLKSAAGQIPYSHGHGPGALGDVNRRGPR